MSRVFVVNEPLRRHAGEWVRIYDLRTAGRFGELVFLTSGQIPTDPAPTVKKLARGLASFTQEDYLLLIGHPNAIAWATAIATRKAGGCVRTLVWTGRGEEGVYIATQAQLWEHQQETAA